MDNKVVTTTARAMRDLNVTAVRFNFRGVGKSEGSFDQGKGETEDLSAVLQWVQKTSPGAAIWLAGFSFGAYVAYKATAKFPVARCVLIAPPVTNFAFDSLPVPQIPWCVIQGDKDEVIAPEAVFNWVKSLQPPPRLVVLEGASHFFHGRLVELREILQQVLISPMTSAPRTLSTTTIERKIPF